MQDMKQLAEDTRESLKQIGKDYPEVMRSFYAMMKAIEGGGAIDKKTIELISIALSVANECSYCIALHVKRALDLGCTRAEIMEAGFVAVFMGGGPAMMYITELYKALNDLEA